MTIAQTIDPPRYSLAHLTIIDVPTPELVRIAYRTGYDFVSPRLICDGLPGRDYSLSRDDDLLRSTVRALAETGLPVHDIELARIADGLDPATYESDLAIGAELGARHLISSVWTHDHSYAVDAFGRLCRLAAQYDLTVNLEWVPIAAVSTMSAALEVIAAVNEPNARLMVDLHHFHRSRERLADLDAIPAGLFSVAQICDAPAEIPTDPNEMTRIIREGRSYLGEGGIDPAAILARMPQCVYSIELPNSAAVARWGAEGHARRCLETAREYLEGQPDIESIVGVRAASMTRWRS